MNAFDSTQGLTNDYLVRGIPNFRDLGGLQTAAGQRLATGVLFRSSHFAAATDDDIQALRALGIRTIVDFRGVNERQAAMGRLAAAGIREVHLPIEPSAVGSLREREARGPVDAAAVHEIMVEVYQRFVRNHAATYRRLIDLLLDESSYPLVFHCTAGKDRTGQAAALVLLALGVPKEAVLDDYLASNERWAAKAGGADIALFSQVSADYLHASLDAMTAHSGSIDDYLRKAIGIDDATRERLGRLLLSD
ncbi:MAG: uncharacterized protein JWQ11_307 [Rhizobacter sp.]|nr:uncharacterized protein [Rhizobacter sp.]